MTDETPEYDYGPEDIEHIVCTFDLFQEPEPHINVTYSVHLKNGEVKEEQEGVLTGIPAASAAIAILEAKYGAGHRAEVVVVDDGQRDWRQRRG